MKITKLNNSIQYYDWGSISMIPNLLGIDNLEETPMAELWMGDHPKAPSSAGIPTGERPLDALIREDPHGIIGPKNVDKFGASLPFLFKVLAAGRPLSIQSHPNKDQATRGYERENAEGIALDSVRRNYRDKNHKPEIICALTPFWAMCGFRPIEEIIGHLADLKIGFLSGLADQLSASPDRDGLRSLLDLLLTVDASQRHKIASEVAARSEGKKEVPFAWATKLHALFPGDMGVLCPFLLNLYRLTPGQALYLGAGELHAYLDGMGVELMANSDNVLRGGLTSKHIDVSELLATLTFDVRPKIVLDGVSVSATEKTYQSEAEEFILSEICVSNGNSYVSAPNHSVEIYIVIDGRCFLHPDSSDETCSLKKGESVLVPASVPGYAIDGNAKLYKAAVP
ncbi:MAG: mannose-6-phosphate isomerase, class I [Spirochaetales bacterium]|nr:mannose-6-phosphate isomerase, class I [Spirochaetales bacterium]